jgi:bacillithiol biosynthesis deacetylase BshB1
MNLLAFGPHPDDIEFGCAPVLIKETRKGNRVKLLILSRGEAGSSGTPELRERESRAAAELMGAEIDFLDFAGDCHLEYRPENAIRLAAEIRRARPQIVLAPNPAENQHPDHVAAGQLVRDACRLARYGGLQELKDQPAHKIGSLFFYNITVHIGRAPDLVIDVSDVVDEWVAAMQCHASQLVNKSYLELQKTAARGLGLAAGMGYAIGLFANDPLCVSHLSELGSSAREF